MKKVLEGDVKRDMGAALLQAVQEMVRGEGVVVFLPVIEAREKSGVL